jgi:DNA repair protein RadC
VTRKFRDVPHVEIRRTQVLQCEDVDLVVKGAHAALPLLREILSGREQESFICLMLDVHNRVTAWREVARGSAESVQVPVRDLYRTALLCGASAILVAHNHPSGDPNPSDADVRMTDMLRMIGTLLNVPVVDHIIIGEGDRYHSFASGGSLAGKSEPLLTGPRQGPELD